MIASLLIILGRCSLSHGRPGASVPRGCAALGGSGVGERCWVGATRSGCSCACTIILGVPCPPLLQA